MSNATNRAYAYSQINAAISEGFYLEAIALCEAIISDAIFLRVGPPKDWQGDFAAALSAWKPRDGAEMDLRERVCTWSIC